MGRRFIAFALGLLLWLPIPVARADGGLIEMSNRPVGPYFVTVMTSPSPLRVGTNDISIMVHRTEKDLELGATVTVTAYGPNGPNLGTVFPATHANATNKFFYAANVHLDVPGTWRFNVQVQGPLGGGQIDFDAVVSPALLGWTPFQIIAEGLPAVALVAFIGWSLWDRRRRRS